MAKTQTQKNKEYKERHQLTRIELLVSKITQVRYTELKKSNPGTTADQLLAMLLDAYQVQQVQTDSNTGTTPEPVVDSVVVPAESNTGTISEPVEVITDSNTGTTETAKQQAQRLLALAGNSLSDAQLLLKTELKSMYPGVAINPQPVHGSAEHALFKRYDSVKKALKNLSKPK